MLCLTLISVLISLLTFGVLFKIYLILTTRWCKSETCLVGKTVLITGANSGLGYRTAIDLAKRGARIILACRNGERAEIARSKIVEKTGNDNIVVKIVDLTSYESVRKFAKEINESEARLDILVNNAGVAALNEVRDEDGSLLMTKVNHYSPFLLTHLLINLMKKTGKSRIINVTSIAASFVKISNLKNLDRFSTNFFVYAKTKLCNILFTIELAKKLNGTEITAYAVHPGMAKTHIGENLSGWERILYGFIFHLFYQPSIEGVQSLIYCCVEKNLEEYNGELFAGCQKIGMFRSARVPGLAQKLWTYTEEKVNLAPAENPFL